MHPQRLASRRLIPIKAAREAANLMEADTNVGAGTGVKAGTVTSV